MSFKKILPISKKLKILFIGTEAFPFAKAGGLGDVMYSLPLALRKLGHDARVMIPRYGIIDSDKYDLEEEIKGLEVPTDQPGPYPFLICNIKTYSGNKAVPTYFLENMEYYEQRANVYGYADDHIRWALLCRGALEFLKISSWKPDIIVASDWQTGILPNYLKTIYRNNETLSKIPVIFAIHNIKYQGMCDFKYLQESDKDSGQESIPDFFNPRLSRFNWMLRGIIYSDFIITTSPTYAKEILTPEYGEGLEKILFEKQHQLVGILNGINIQDYNPGSSLHIPINYTVAGSFLKKNKNKILLQKRLGLENNPEAFLVGMVSRFAEQKGFDILEPVMESLLKNLPFSQFVFVGDGESRYKEAIKKNAESFPGRVSFYFEFDLPLPHFVFAASDAVLLPSKFEPCGIVQMQAMRYGAIPIARATGGLVDTIENLNSQNKKGDGFLFKEYDSTALFAEITKAATCFQFKDFWRVLVKRAMKKDFSWKKSAKEYLKIFYNIAGKTK